MKRKLFSVILISATIAVLCGMSFYAFFDKTTVSESENRRLETLPAFTLSSWKSDDFQTKMNTFISDHVYKREKWISYAQWLEDKMKLPGKDLILSGTSEGNEQGDRTETDYLVLDDHILPLYTHNDNSMMYFYESNKALLAAVKKAIPSVKEYYMIMPGRIDYEPDDIRKNADDSEPDIEAIYKNTDPSIKTIYTHDAVREGVEKYGINDIYFRTDHHWTQLGSYFAAREFCNTIGRPIDLSNYTAHNAYDFQGYLTVKMNLTENYDPDPLGYYLRNDGVNCPETVYLKDENTGAIQPVNDTVINEYRGGYYTYIYKSQFAYTVVDGTGPEGTTLTMVTDSYGLALSTWLTDAYDTIVIVDPRYYTGTDENFLQLLVKYNTTDFLLALQEDEMCVSMFNQEMAANLLGVNADEFKQ